jgi:hypothetical protein
MLKYNNNMILRQYADYSDWKLMPDNYLCDNKRKMFNFSDILEAASNGQFAADDRNLKVR